MIAGKLADEIERRAGGNARLKLKGAAQAINIGVIGLNSFLILLFRPSTDGKMRYVVCAATLFYALVFFVHALICRRKPDRL